MQISVSFRNTQPSNALREYVIKKIGKVNKLLVKPEEAQVTLAVDKRDHIAQVNLRSNGEMLTASETAEDLYAAIDLVVDKVERQARRYKEKLTSHR